MKQGFTLIEMIVVIGIAILVTVGSIIGVTAATNRRQTKTVAERIKYIFSEAEAMAKSPDDSDIGLKKIEIDVYPYYNDPEPKNRITVNKCMDTASPCTVKTPIDRLEFNAPGGIYVKKNGCEPSTNFNSNPGSPFIYFSICAVNGCSNYPATSQIGQVSDVDNSSVEYICLPVTNLDVNETYNIKINSITGLITMEKV